MLDSEALVNHYRSRLTTALTDVRGARPGSRRGDAVLNAAVRLVEELLGMVALALEDRESGLRQDLRARNTTVRLLQDQLEVAELSLRELHKTKNRKLLRSALTGIGSLALAISAGFAGGTAEGIASRNAEPVRAGLDAVRDIETLAAACAALEQAIEEVSGLDDSKTPESPQLPFDQPEQPPYDEEDFDVADDPWLQAQDDYGNLMLSGMERGEAESWRDAGFHPDEAVDWHDVGVTPQEASQWRGLSVDPGEAYAWKRLGITPPSATDWVDSFYPEGAYEWILEGFAAADVPEWVEHGFEAYDARRWADEGFAAEEAATKTEAATED